jgi:hypothetical protein
MSLINSKVRFAYDAETDRIFDYLTGRYAPVVGKLKSADGVWDLAKLKVAIVKGDAIESALLRDEPVDKVAVANQDFKAAGTPQPAAKVVKASFAPAKKP